MSQITYKAWMMECWPHLKALELSTGTYVLAPLPENPQVFDCGPLSLVAKRVLAQLRSRSELKISKATTAALADYLASEPSGLSEMTKARLLNNLGSIDSAGADYQQLVQALLAVPQVANDIAERSQRAVEDRLAQLTSEKQRIENLRRQAAELEAANRKLEHERDKTVKEMRTAIRKAFNTATSKEVAALGEMSLLRALLPNATSQVDAAPAPSITLVPSVPAGPKVEHRFVNRHDILIQKALVSFGMEPVCVDVAAEVLTIAARAGAAIVLEGPGAGEIAVKLASVLTHNRVRVIDVPVGLIEPSIQAEWLEPTDCDVLLLLNANLSDLAVYASGLISLMTRRLIGQGEGSLPIIMVAGSGGPAAVPWPLDLESLAIKFSLAGLEEVASGNAILASETNKRAPMGRLLEQALERQADSMESTKDVRSVLKALLDRLA